MWHPLYKESEGLIEAMKRLKLLGIPVLPVYDSLIVSAAAQGVTERTLSEVFERRFGVDFVFEVSKNNYCTSLNNIKKIINY